MALTPNYSAHAGNQYVFSTLAASASADIKFDRPVKRIKFEGSSGFIVLDSTSTEVGFITDVAEFPNNYGYPYQIKVKNPDASNTVAPTVQVLEYGDSVNENYFKHISPLL